MDYNKHVDAIPTRQVDAAATANRLRLSLREIYGDTLDENVRTEGDNIYANALDADGNVLGQFRIFVPQSNCPVWFVHDRNGIVLKDPKEGTTRNVKATGIEREITNGLSVPNGDPETVIGAALLSHMITPEGVISFQPMVESIEGGRVTILQVSDAEGLRSFLERIVAM